MYNLLRQLCRERGFTVTQLCIQVTGNSGNLATWKKGYMRSDYLLRAGEILNVSTDYLLGRTDNPGIISAAYIGGDNHGVQAVKNGTVNVSTEQVDDTTKEISSILSGLSFRERTELMTIIYKFADEHKK
jgi:hypothetical protein